MRTHSATVQAPSDLGTAVIGIPEGSDLELDLRLESVMEGVLVSGTVRGTAKGECSRCLDDITRELTVEIAELFAYPEKTATSAKRGADNRGADDTESDLDDEEYVLNEDDMADLEPSLRDSVVTALPFQPLCREDCPGLCSECGARLADDPGHHHDVVDPRWSALQSMLEPTSVSDETKES
ncbi:DUF177 domain-containing protein [Promicromonospora sp. Populi]|uniref:YceD family protein n=1 Tax=Promicromonospora sp. Populi TaxID=3239420 RepID=UPI0034E1EC19